MRFEVRDFEVLKSSFFIIVGLLACSIYATAANTLSSANGKIAISQQTGRWLVSYQQQPVLEITDFGFEGLPNEALHFEAISTLNTEYVMLAGKRSHCQNRANIYRAPLADGITLEMRLYDDGIAFRYEWTTPKSFSQTKEQTTYRIAEGIKRWMQQWTDSYEGFFPLTTTSKVKALPSYSAVSKDADGHNTRWGYPALLEPVDGVFALITEANIERGQSASCLYNKGELFRVTPDRTFDELPSLHTPWRVIIVGSLADVVESTLVTDVSNPCQLEDISWIHPGVVSWVYWAYNHGSNDFNIIKKYVDMAAALGLNYVLIDAEWDTMRDGKTIEDAVAYAHQKFVRPLIWYNSSVGWVDGAPTPKYRLNKAEDREREFAWCERIGVAGVKIDFFSGDDQRNMDYCLDLLECAARHHLLVNFHGATVPRGWQRTYPHLLSTEGVYGAEWYNNVATFTEKAARHNATLPFTRNVIGPMDYTPCAFSNSQHPHITTSAHELALTVLFESGLQHLADRPESFYAQPQEVREFLGSLPAAWNETRFVAGYPGAFVVLARRSGQKWYVAGINGTDQPIIIPMPNDLQLPQGKVSVFADSDTGQWDITTRSQIPSSVTLLPRGGFVWRIKN